MKCLLFGAFLVILLFTFTLKEGFDPTGHDLFEKDRKIFVLFYNNHDLNTEHKKTITNWKSVQANNEKIMGHLVLNYIQQDQPVFYSRIRDKYKPGNLSMFLIENNKIIDTYRGDTSVEALTDYVNLKFNIT